jgi:hypothetical protein
MCIYIYIFFLLGVRAELPDLGFHRQHVRKRMKEINMKPFDFTMTVPPHDPTQGKTANPASLGTF